MLSIITALCVSASLSSPNCEAREASEAALRDAPWVALDIAMRSTECPEARARLIVLRNRATIREVDRLIKAGPLPEADDIWPCRMSDRYQVGLWFGMPPEFYRAPYREVLAEYDVNSSQQYSAVRTVVQSRRTRAALVAYASRTGDWETVRSIVK